ncbi:class I SAM-dependent methyltransferase [Acinetobacter bouvetii]|uniref:Putative methyltransferase n=1 Tax=Acinetobacter bouvetii TaxID=202951 RepID=A0A811GFC1_9GAMM|nr:class I SAM-dependent methyltransferase [Acinetobacter bouvetii]CAB1218999.1 putative methyltransferase [Acinetobacter bouvetii]
MTQSLHPAAQKGFSSAAELYQQVRPNYPQDIVPWLAQQIQLNQNSKVIDLGSGTGKFLPYLQQLTSHILAVEPIPAMLEQLRQAYPEIQTLQASSEHLPILANSIDAVICAQSFHWFANLETLGQIHQVLKSEGHLTLIWNQRDVDIDWVKALADLIEPLEGNTPRYHSAQWKQVFEDQSLFQLANTAIFRQQHIGTVEQVVSKRLLSTSFIAAMPEHEQQRLKTQFEQIVLKYTGKQPQEEIAFPYITYAYDFKKIDQK